MTDLARLDTDVATRLRGVAAMVTLEDKELKRALNLEARRSLLPYVKGSIVGAAPNALARRVARSATVQTSRGFPYLKVTGKFGAKSSRRTNLAAGVEFGAVGQVRIGYERKRTKQPGSSHVVRRTTAQFRPRTSSGRFIYPTAERVTPALAAAWLQVVEDYYKGLAVKHGA